MIKLDGDDLRNIAQVLDALLVTEQETGIRMTGYQDGELTTVGNDVIKFAREEEDPAPADPGGAEPVVRYVIILGA